MVTAYVGVCSNASCLVQPSPVSCLEMFQGPRKAKTTANKLRVLHLQSSAISTYSPCWSSVCLSYYFHMCTGGWVCHRTHVEVRGQLYEAAVSFHLYVGITRVPRPEKQVSSPSKPSSRPMCPYRENKANSIYSATAVYLRK